MIRIYLAIKLKRTAHRKQEQGRKAAKSISAAVIWHRIRTKVEDTKLQ